MGIFDIDSGADNHLLNEQFHVFSKSPASVATALGDASNRSGHTVTASDVWGQEIPAFFYAKTQAVADSYKSLAKTNDLCRIGNSVAIFENGNWVVKYNSYTDIPDGHKFKNANGDEVIRFHKNRLAYNLNLDNNAGDDGLNTTAKIQGWDDVNGKVYDYVATAPKFVSQFVTSTDKIVDGIPSKGFGPFVMAGTTTGDITKVLPEGTSDSNHYIANSFAGIIQFNKTRTDAIYVHAFEYCGKTLKSAYSDIVELDEKLSKISVTASGGVQDASTDAKAAGLSVTTEKRTNSEGKEETIPVLDIETGSVTTGETKLVSGGAVKTYVDTTALAEGGSIANAIANYVAENAKVSVNEVEAKTVTVASGSQTGDLVQIVVTNDKTKAEDGEIGIKLSAQIEAAQWDEATQSFKNPDAVLIAGVAQTVINNTIINQITEVVGDVGEGEKPTIGTAIKKGITDATLTSGDNAIESATGDATGKLVTAAQVKEYVDTNAKVTLTAATADGSTGITISPNATESTEFTIGIDQTVIATKKSVDDLSGIVSALPATIEAAKSAADAAMEEAQKKVASVTGPTTGLVTVTGDKEVTITVSETIATKSDITTEINKLTATDGAITTLSGKVSAIETSLADGGKTAEAIADAKKAGTDAQSSVDTLSSTSLTYSTTADNVTLTLGGTVSSPKIQFAGVASTTALTALENKVNAYHEAGVSYKVHTGTTLPDLSVAENVENYKNVILLVPSYSSSGAFDETTAITGGYVEWLCVNKGTKEAPSWDWEQIGTTEADLYGYVRHIDTGNVDWVGRTNPVYAEISSTGYLKLGIDTATSDKLGVSKMFTGDLVGAPSTVTDTAVSVKTAEAMYSSLASLAGGIQSDVNSKVADVIADFYLGLAGTAVTKSNSVVTISDTFVRIKANAMALNAKSVINGVVTTNRVDEPYAKRPIATSKIVNGASMFEDGMNLTTWVDDLECLTSGYAMFAGCSNLTTFIGDLGALTNGKGMFRDCQLSLESVEYISDTINDVTELTDDETDDGNAKVRKQFDFGYSVMSDEMDALNTAIAEIKAKGWTVYANNQLK